MANPAQAQNQTIFISIASFCDAELVPTLTNLLENALYPENLRFGICLQDSAEVYQQFPFKEDPRFQILHVLPGASQGCCWARSEIQKLLRDEPYYLQLDSHHRFVPGWDELAKTMLHACPSPKPLLTSYLIAYEKEAPELAEKVPYKLEGDKFYSNYKLRITPHTIDDYLDHDAPVPGHLLSAHFIFTFSSWVTEVPYDPELYFEGEEDTLALRSWTNGWDLFHPHRAIGYHFYTRAGETKHHDVVKTWPHLDQHSLLRMKQVLQVENERADLGKFGLGKIRTLEDWQKRYGIDFQNQTIASRHDGQLLFQRFENKRWVYDGGYVGTHDNITFHEVKDGAPVAEFVKFSDGPDHLILYDHFRQLFLKIDAHSCSFKTLADPSGINWNMLYGGKWLGHHDTVLRLSTRDLMEKHGSVQNPGQAIGLAVLHTPNVSEWAELAIQNIRHYAQRHNHTFYHYCDLIALNDVPYWNKIKLLQELLDAHEYTVWMDCDAIFTNPEITFAEIIAQQPDKDLLVCNDIGGWALNTGVIIIRRSEWSKKMLQALWAMEHFPHSMAAEQGQMIRLLARLDPEQKHHHIFDQKVFNCHPRVHEDGDFILHMMGLSGEERMVVFSAWNEKLGIS